MSSNFYKTPLPCSIHVVTFADSLHTKPGDRVLRTANIAGQRARRVKVKFSPHNAVWLAQYY